MSVTSINAELRRLVVARAEGLCAYCLIAEEDTFYGCEADHIISEKHGGPTPADNLAYACVFCNQAKGSDVGSIPWESGEFVRFFNPRTDRWADHIVLADRAVCSRLWHRRLACAWQGPDTGETPVPQPAANRSNQIEGVTVMGAVTARILGFNSGERILERQALQGMQRYPSAAALQRMQA